MSIIAPRTFSFWEVINHYQPADLQLARNAHPAYERLLTGPGVLVRQVVPFALEGKFSHLGKSNFNKMALTLTVPDRRLRKRSAAPMLEPVAELDSCSYMAYALYLNIGAAVLHGQGQIIHRLLLNVPANDNEMLEVPLMPDITWRMLNHFYQDVLLKP